jgi:hypothetical protein
VDVKSGFWAIAPPVAEYLFAGGLGGDVVTEVAIALRQVGFLLEVELELGAGAGQEVIDQLDLHHLIVGTGRGGDGCHCVIL